MEIHLTLSWLLMGNLLSLGVLLMLTIWLIAFYEKNYMERGFVLGMILASALGAVTQFFNVFNAFYL